MCFFLTRLFPCTCTQSLLLTEVWASGWTEGVWGEMAALDAASWGALFSALVSLTLHTMCRGSFSMWDSHSFTPSRTMGMRLTTPPKWFFASSQLRWFTTSWGYLWDRRKHSLSSPGNAALVSPAVPPWAHGERWRCRQQCPQSKRALMEREKGAVLWLLDSACKSSRANTNICSMKLTTHRAGIAGRSQNDVITETSSEVR